MAYKTTLGGGDANFQGMMENGFGIVTVMNARIFDALSVDELKEMTAYQIVKKYKDDSNYICKLDTLKIANVTQEGPTKTVTGGQFSNPLIKFGKSARLEMQDALGNANAIEALCGGIREWSDNSLVGLHFGEDFVGPKMIIGDSFFIDRKSGQQVPVIIVFYQFLPDSIFNLTQDAEGDATVFDMNGDLLTSVILVADKDGDNTHTHGVFYSIVDPKSLESVTPYIRKFASRAKVLAAAETLNAGDQVDVYNADDKDYDTLTIESISEAYDGAGKKVVYTIKYVGE